MAESTFTIAASGGDYTSISAYVTAQAADLVSGGNNHVVTMDTSALNDNTAFVGFTTDATNNIKFIVAAGREHGGQAGNHVIYSTGSAVFRPVATCDGLHIDGLGATCSNNSVVTRANGGTDYTIENSFLENEGTTIDVVDIVITGNHTVKNTFLIGGQDCIVGYDTNSLFSYLTAINASARGIVNAVMKNCIAMDCTGDDFQSKLTGSDKLLSSDTTGTTGLTSKTSSNQFVSITAGSEDLNLKAGSDAEGAGSAIGGITTDYEGDTRDASTPDCGADEFVTAGGFQTAWARNANTLIGCSQ